VDEEPPAPGTIITGPGAATATESKEPDAEEAPKAAGAEPKERARKDEEKKKGPIPGKVQVTTASQGRRSEVRRRRAGPWRPAEANVASKAT
jgi:hypothetical protein